MALNTPSTAKQIDQRMKTDVQRELTGSNPFLKNSWLGAIITSIANRIFDFYIQLNEAIKQSLPDTATDTQLESWAAIWGINRLAATVATGNIAATGTAASIIPISTPYAASDGLTYTTDAAATIITQVLPVTSITRSGTTATVTMTNPHGLASNVPVTIAGAVETDYNVTDAVIQVTGIDTFTYQVSGSPASPATGTITAAATFITVPVTSDGFGVENNQSLDAVLTLQSPIVGVDNDAQVDASELAGGTDQEIDTDLRTRLLFKIQNPVAHFNVAEIDAKAKEVNGVTRVFVEEVTPAIGQVTIYFMRDNDVVTIPTAPEIATVKAKILEIKPANTADADVIVAGPTPITTNYTFSALSPNTLSMQEAITANLQQFYAENTTVGVNIVDELYSAAIANTVDTTTGDTIVSFTLSGPAGDIAIASGEIGVLGTITFP